MNNKSYFMFRITIISCLLFIVVLPFPYLLNEPIVATINNGQQIQSSNYYSNDNINEKDLLYYSECLHGGLLTTGKGNHYQYSTYYVLDRLFEALEQYGNYKVCLELEPSTMSLINQKYINKLKTYIEDGRVEILLTSFDQNFLLNVSYDFALYSLRLAKETIETVFAYTPKVFAAQEFALRPDLPQLLHEVGISYVLGRVWMSYWGNLEYWTKKNNQDLLKWKYGNHSVTLIPDYSSVWSWTFTEGYVEEFIAKAHKAGINHPLQVSFDDLEIWKKWEDNVKYNRPFPFFHKDNDLVQFVTLTEYIEKIADDPEDEVEIPSNCFKLRLPDKHDYINWEGEQLNKTQFRLIVNKTQELAEIWLSMYIENKDSPFIKQLFRKISKLYFHDIWVAYNYAFGSCVDEGFENWFEYWLHYYQLTFSLLNYYNVIL